MLNGEKPAADVPQFVADLLRSDKLERAMVRVRKQLVVGLAPHRSSEEWREVFNQHSLRFSMEKFDVEAKVAAAATLAARAIEAIEQYVT